jgi:hypothetical protein
MVDSEQSASQSLWWFSGTRSQQGCPLARVQLVLRAPVFFWTSETSRAHRVPPRQSYLAPGAQPAAYFSIKSK